MRNVVRFPDHTLARKEAAAWIARLDGEPLSDEEEAKLRAWLEQDASHLEALRELAELWANMDCMALLAELFPLPPAQGPKRQVPRWQWLRDHGLGAALATLAGVALLLGGVVSFNQYPTSPVAGNAEPVELVYQTRTGQQSEVVLQDGSTLFLNTRSLARVRFGQGERAVFLSEGEAHFQVARNPQRPFVVYAGQGQVRAVGTAFSVRVSGEKVEVLVDEGEVEVVASVPATVSEPGKAVPALAPRKVIKLKEGGATSYGSAIEVAQYLAEPEVRQRLAWRSGKWLFEGETLEEVVAEVGRYTDTRIEIVDPAIADLRIGGFFDIGEIDALLAVLDAGFGVRSTRLSGNHLQLSAKEESVGP